MQNGQQNLWDREMKAIYSKDDDRLILITGKGTLEHKTVEYSNHVRVDFNDEGLPTMIEILDASILFKTSKDTLSKFFEMKE